MTKWVNEPLSLKMLAERAVGVASLVVLMEAQMLMMMTVASS